MPLYQYTATASDDSEETGEKFTSKTHYMPVGLVSLQYFLLLLLAGIGGYILGHYSTSRGCQSLPPIQDGFYTAYETSRTFQFNLTYAMAPTNITDELWLDLYPKNYGFVTDEKLNLKFAGISAFHSLHCVDMFRRVFHKASQGTDLRPAHIEHCIEYLRQGVLCAADGTIEHGNLSTMLIEGEGVAHHCGNYDALVEWAEQRPFVPPLHD